MGSITTTIAQVSGHQDGEAVKRSGLVGSESAHGRPQQVRDHAEQTRLQS
jgi:hypothetical protein